MEQSNGIKTWQWVVTVIVIVVLVILGYVMFKGNGSTTEEVTPVETTEPLSSTTSEVNRVVISDQFPGNIVYLSSVQLSKPGFVVIRKDNKGTPGDVIGSQYFDKGINPGKITLTSATVEGGIYYAQLYVDDGDKKYSSKDESVKDSSGKDIMKLFRVSTSVTEMKG